MGQNAGQNPVLRRQVLVRGRERMGPRSCAQANCRGTGVRRVPTATRVAAGVRGAHVTFRARPE